MKNLLISTTDQEKGGSLGQKETETERHKSTVFHPWYRILYTDFGDFGRQVKSERLTSQNTMTSQTTDKSFWWLMGFIFDLLQGESRTEYSNSRTEHWFTLGEVSFSPVERETRMCRERNVQDMVKNKESIGLGYNNHRRLLVDFYVKSRRERLSPPTHCVKTGYPTFLNTPWRSFRGIFPTSDLTRKLEGEGRTLNLNYNLYPVDRTLLFFIYDSLRPIFPFSSDLGTTATSVPLRDWRSGDSLVIYSVYRGVLVHSDQKTHREKGPPYVRIVRLCLDHFYFLT